MHTALQNFGLFLFVVFLAVMSYIGMAHAGGPVILEDKEDMIMVQEPRSNGIIPIVIGGLVLCALFCGGDDDPEPPKVVCFTEC